MSSLLLLLALVDRAEAAPGVVEGLVLDGDRRGPIAGATVRVDLPGDADPTAVTDGTGRFLVEAEPGSWPIVVRLASGAERTLGPFRVVDGAITEVIVSWFVAWPPIVSVEEPPEPLGPAGPVEAVVAGAVRGVVRDEAGKPVAGARVYARGQSVEAITDEAGVFTLGLPVGVHDLSVLRQGFASRTVAGVEAVAEGVEAAPVEVTLLPSGVALDAFTVTAPRIEGSTASLLEERRQATGVVETIGAEQMKKSGDTNAALALRRVTGLTLIGGRFVFVRGLGDRYSQTLLNGSMLPSPEPERRTVPLDLFPTSVLEGVVVQKTFSPDRSGEFGGGIVQIRTRSVPQGPVLQVSGTAGYVHDVTGRSVLSGPRGALDGLGFGRDGRALPQPVVDLGDRPIRGRSLLDPDGLTDEDLERLGESFSNTWDLTEQTVLPDGALQVTWGDGWQLPGARAPRLGALLSLNWGSSWGVDDATRNVFSAGAEGPFLTQATTYTRLQQRVQLGGMAVVGAEWGKDHEVASTTLVNRVSQYEAGRFAVDDPTSTEDNLNTQTGWTEQQLIYEQLAGRHKLSRTYPAQLEWRYAYAQADRWEPDQREYSYNVTSTGTFLSQSGAWALIRYGELVDRSHDGGLDLTLPFLLELPRPGFVKLGGMVLDRERASDLRRFGWDVRGAGPDLSRPLGEILTPDNIGASDEDDRSYYEISEIVVNSDDYAATQRLYAGYAMTDVPFLKRLRLMAGARVEASTQIVRTFQAGSASLEPIEAKLENVDVLPGTSLTIGVGPKKNPESMLVRVSYGRTLSRPEFRELAPVFFQEQTTGAFVEGNPALRRAVLDNVDVRWEWYFRRGESVSVAGFYKEFDDPIEAVTAPNSGSGIVKTLGNADRAQNFGAEIDFRLGWGVFHPKLEDVFVSGNASFISSRVFLPADTTDTNTERPLQGQSPWVVNATLGYDNPDLGISVALLYNVFGPRLVDVGRQGIPDTFEQPVHRLDFVGIAPIAKGFQIQLRAQNLLDWPVEQTAGDQLVESLRDGFALRLGLQWTR